MAENAGLENHRIKSFKNKGRDVEVSLDKPVVFKHHERNHFQVLKGPRLPWPLLKQFAYKSASKPSGRIRYEICQSVRLCVIIFCIQSVVIGYWLTQCVLL